MLTSHVSPCKYIYNASPSRGCWVYFTATSGKAKWNTQAEEIKGLGPAARPSPLSGGWGRSRRAWGRGRSGEVLSGSRAARERPPGGGDRWGREPRETPTSQGRGPPGGGGRSKEGTEAREPQGTSPSSQAARDGALRREAETGPGLAEAARGRGGGPPPECTPLRSSAGIPRPALSEILSPPSGPAGRPWGRRSQRRGNSTCRDTVSARHRQLPPPLALLPARRRPRLLVGGTSRGAPPLCRWDSVSSASMWAGLRGAPPLLGQQIVGPSC